MEEITATELKQRLDDGEDIQIIDVREPYEHELARLENSKLIPLGQVVDRMSEIDPARDAVVHCRGGVRSAKAIDDLRGAGFAGRLSNLKGGITAWSNEVDPDVPKYDLRTAGGGAPECPAPKQQKTGVSGNVA